MIIKRINDRATQETGKPVIIIKDRKYNNSIPPGIEYDIEDQDIKKPRRPPVQKGLDYDFTDAPISKGGKRTVLAGSRPSKIFKYDEIKTPSKLKWLTSTDNPEEIDLSSISTPLPSRLIKKK
jgi:hypothetical protein